MAGPDDRFLELNRNLRTRIGQLTAGLGGLGTLSEDPPVFAIRIGQTARTGAGGGVTDDLRILAGLPEGLDPSRLMAFAVAADGRAVQLTTRRSPITGLVEFAMPAFTNLGSVHTIAIGERGPNGQPINMRPIRIDPSEMSRVFRETYGFGMNDQARGARPRLWRLTPCGGVTGPDTVRLGVCFAPG